MCHVIRECVMINVYSLYHSQSLGSLHDHNSVYPYSTVSAFSQHTLCQLTLHLLFNSAKPVAHNHVESCSSCELAVPDGR